MNARVATALVGLVSLGLGFAGLVYPERMMGLLGFSSQNASHLAATLGEVRATYGGIFLVLGAYTLLAAFDPAGNRLRLVLLGLVWLGACAGRLFGVYVDGNPGLIGWSSAAFELVMGGTLLLAAQSRGTAVEIAATPPVVAAGT
jgi:Domain of unknown function (DUF4345)